MFTVFKQEAGSYVEKFRGNGFYTLRVEDNMFVKGRDTEYGATVFKLVPPRTMLYTKIADPTWKEDECFPIDTDM